MKEWQRAELTFIPMYEYACPNNVNPVFLSCSKHDGIVSIKI